MRKFYLFWKRFFDIFASTIAIIVFGIPMLIVAIIIKCDSKGPVLFKQDRVGKNKKIFKIWKFRSMKVDAPKDSATHLLENPDAYITKWGKFIRKTSIDELPQLFNILAGHMSVIGPRPALWNQFDLIEERDKYNVNSVKPGLSGLAQVMGRDELEIDAKAKIDGDYVRKMNLFLDIKILFMTVFNVFRSKGVVEGKQDKKVEETKEEKETINV